MAWCRKGCWSGLNSDHAMTNRLRLNILFFCSLLITLSFIGLRMVVPLLAIELGASTLLIGVLMSAFAVLPVLLSVQAGRWIDRAGIVLPMIVCTVSITAGMVLLALAPYLWTLFFVNALGGLAYISFHLALTAAAGAIGRPEDRASNFAWITVANGLGIFAGPVMAGHIVDAFGHATAIAALAVAPALVAGLVTTLRTVRTARPATPAQPFLRSIRELLAIPELVRVMLIAVALGIGWDLYSVFLPVYASGIGLSAGTIGNIMGAFGIAIFLIRLLVPALLRLMNEWRIVVCALFLAVPVFIFIPLTREPAVLMTLTFTFGIAWGAVQPILTALLFGASPDGRIGEVAGLRMTLHTGLQLVMPTIFGSVSAIAGMTPVFWSVGGMLMFTGWLTRGRWRAGP